MRSLLVSFAKSHVRQLSLALAASGLLIGCADAAAAESAQDTTADPSVSAESAAVTPRTLAGTWAGSASGTFAGAPFAFVGTFQVSAIDATTLGATLTLDTTVGPLTADCTAPYDRATQSAVATCHGSNGLDTTVHLVVTDNAREVRFFENMPDLGFFATGSLRRQ